MTTMKKHVIISGLLASGLFIRFSALPATGWGASGPQPLPAGVLRGLLFQGLAVACVQNPWPLFWRYSSSQLPTDIRSGVVQGCEINDAAKRLYTHVASFDVATLVSVSAAKRYDQLYRSLLSCGAEHNPCTHLHLGTPLAAGQWALWVHGFPPGEAGDWTHAVYAATGMVLGDRVITVIVEGRVANPDHVDPSLALRALAVAQVVVQRVREYDAHHSP